MRLWARIKAWFFLRFLACGNCAKARATTTFWTLSVCASCHAALTQEMLEMEERYQIDRRKKKLRLEARAKQEFEAEQRYRDKPKP